MTALRFLGVCSGIEAATVTLAPLGGKPSALVEIDPFACHVLAHRHFASRLAFMPDPDAVQTRHRRARAAAIKAVASLSESAALLKFGYLTQFRNCALGFDLLVGGTPC